MIVVDANISVKLPPAYLLVCSWLIEPCKCCHNIYRSYLGATSSSSSYQSSNCVDKIFCLCFAGIDETVEMVRAEGGTCIGYRVDISKKEEVYKAADVIRAEMGDVSKNHACASNFTNDDHLQVHVIFSEVEYENTNINNFHGIAVEFRNWMFLFVVVHSHGKYISMNLCTYCVLCTCHTSILLLNSRNNLFACKVLLICSSQTTNITVAYMLALFLRCQMSALLRVEIANILCCLIPIPKNNCHC